MGRILLLTVAYWAAHKLGYLLRIPPANLVVVWPAAGIALGGLLVTPVSERWKLALLLAAANLLAGVHANVTLGLSPLLAIPFLLAAAVEVATCLLVFRAAGRSPVTLATTTQVGALIVAAILASAVSAIVGAWTQWAMLDRPFLRSYVGWWSSNSLSILLITPVVVALARLGSPGQRQRTRFRRAESVLFLVVWTAAAWEVFHAGMLGSMALLPYVLVALLTWAAARLGSGVVALSLCVLAVVIANSPLVGYGPSPLGGEDPRSRMLLTQLFLGVVSGMGLLLSASRRETVDALAVASEQRGRVESLADNLPGGAVFQLECAPGARPRFSYISAGVIDIVGVDPGALGRDAQELFNLIHPEDMPRLSALGRPPGPDSQPGRQEFRLTRPDGTMRWVTVSYSPARVLEGPPVWDGILFDVSEQRRSQEALRQSEARLLEAQKMELVGQLAGGVAHDFNNLLTVVMGYADMLTAAPGNDEVRESATQIVEAAKRASSLTQQLLAFGRRTLLAPSVLDLNEVVQRLAPIVRRTVGESISVELELAPSQLWLRVDPTQLERVCLNLILNARDAMPNGGTLTIRTDTAALGPEQAQRHEVSSGDYVRVSVRDTGTGMSPAVRGRLFEPFFTTKPFGRGSGMGLAAVHGVVRQSRGFIDVDTAVGRGSTFTVSFPRHTGGAVQAAPAEPSRPHGHETILLVEDSTPVRRLVERTLRQQGYTVWAASTAEAAELLVEDAATAPALVVTDVVMPGTDGVQLVARLRRHHPGLRAIFISGYSDDAVLVHGLEAGRSDFLHKPFSPATLATRVREMLDGARGDADRPPAIAAT